MSLLWAWFSGLLKTFALPIILVLTLALAALWGMTTLKINNLQVSLANEKVNTEKAKRDLSDAQAKGATELATAQGQVINLNLMWQAKFNLAERNRLDETLRLQRLLDASSGERDRLYNLSRKAYQPDPSVTSGSSCDSGALARANATTQTFGELLEGSDRVSESLGIQSEKLASQVRGLQAALTALRSKLPVSSAISSELVGTDPPGTLQK